jgi:hypothetical protein
LLSSTSRVVGQAKRFAQDIAAGVKRAGNVSKQRRKVARAIARARGLNE